MKVVVVSQYIYPFTYPRAHRTTELVKEFARQGHDVTVYACIGDEPYNNDFFPKNVVLKNIPLHWQWKPITSANLKKRSLIDKILSRILGRWLEFPLFEFRNRIFNCLKKEGNIDLLISIADPHHIHWGCAKFVRQNQANIGTWIADCGDPFMENDQSNYHRQYFRKYEIEFCTLADFITVPLENSHHAYYTQFHQKIKVIPQGFDFEFPKLVASQPNLIPKFAYAGTFYSDIRNPEKIIEFLAELSNNFEFHLYSPPSKIVDHIRKRLGNKVVIHHTIARLALLEELKSMDFLVNIENVNSPFQKPSKLIDYAITGRPILSINPNEINKDQILRFLAGNYADGLVVENLEQYHISNVAKNFIALTEAIPSNIVSCSHCLYNSINYPKITLNKEGVCDICEVNLSKIHAVQKKRDEQQIPRFIRHLKSKRKGKYDCIIGISGGADSSYLVHLAKQWELNPLLVHVDGGWNSEASVQNIKRLVAATEFDYYAEVLPWEEIQDVQKAFIKANVLDIDLPFDNAMMSYLYRTAKKFDIHFILNGYSSETEGIMPDIYTHYKLDKKNILAIHRKFGTVPLQKIKFLGTFNYICFEKISRIKFYQPLDWIDYNKEEVKQILIEKYNWQDYGNKHFENLFTRFYQSYILPEKFKIDKRISHLSILICSGQLQKAEALKQLQEFKRNEAELIKDKTYFLKKLSISSDEFEKYMLSKPVSHRNFKSDLDLYDVLRPHYTFVKKYFKINLFSS